MKSRYIAHSRTRRGIRNIPVMQGYVRWQVVVICIAVSALSYGASRLYQQMTADAGQTRVRLRAHSGVSAASLPVPAGKPALVPNAAAVPERRPGDGEAEVCGLGIVTASAQDPDGAAHIPASSRSNAERASVAALASSQDQRARAAGLLMQARAAQRDGASTDSSIEQLAQMAERSNDPSVYAITLQACDAYRSRNSGSGACDGVNAAQWARLDPGNAAPWLKLAEQAQASGDQAALAEAIYRVSLAARIDWHANDFAMVAMQALPQTAEPLDRALVTHLAREAESSWTPPSYTGLTAFCSSSDDVNRAQLCDSAANLLVRSGGSPVELRTGMRLGQIVGWDAQRIENLRLQRDVLSNAIASAPFHEQGYSCRSIEQLQNWTVLEHGSGELGAARAMLQSSGQTLQFEMAALKRRREEQRNAIQ
jgi:hypothetical protein